MRLNDGIIYLDNAATTATLKEYSCIASDYAENQFFNPSAPYGKALDIQRQLNKVRKNMLNILNGEGQIIFTSSGTESNNLALFGGAKRGKILISASEHPSVYNAAAELKQRGFEVVEVPVDTSGRVDIESLISLIDKQTTFVSIMWVNNETGAVNDIKKLCFEAKRINPSIIFHSDGVQAAGKVPINLINAGIDLFTFSGHKLHAPKGAGALYIKKNVQIKPILFGGGQESKIRPSTENVPSIMALNSALSDAVCYDSNNVAQLKEFLVINLNKETVRIISECDNSSPYIISLALKHVRGEIMLHALEKHNVLIGTGSACSSNVSDTRFAKIFKLPQEYANGVIRVSLSRFTSRQDIEYFTNCLNLEYSSLISHLK